MILNIFYSPYFPEYNNYAGDYDNEDGFFGGNDHGYGFSGHEGENDDHNTFGGGYGGNMYENILGSLGEF